MSYVCAELQADVCVDWVQTTFLLPPLSVDEALSLGAAYLGVMAVAWGFSLIAVQFFKR